MVHWNYHGGLFVLASNILESLNVWRCPDPGLWYLQSSVPDKYLHIPWVFLGLAVAYTVVPAILGLAIYEGSRIYHMRKEDLDIA